jgi:hypothetical protein
MFHGESFRERPDLAGIVVRMAEEHIEPPHRLLRHGVPRQQGTCRQLIPNRNRLSSRLRITATDPIHTLLTVTALLLAPRGISMRGNRRLSLRGH